MKGTVSAARSALSKSVSQWDLFAGAASRIPGELRRIKLCWRKSVQIERISRCRASSVAARPPTASSGASLPPVMWAYALSDRDSAAHRLH